MPDSAPEDPTPRAADSSKKRTFARRLLSTLILWASFGTAFYLAWQWLFVSLLAVIALAALLEYFHLFQEDRHRRFRSQTVLVATLYLGILAARAAGLCPDWLASFDGGALAALVILIVASRLRRPLEGLRSLEEITVAVFGFVYIVILLAFTGKTLLLDLKNASGTAGTAHFYVLYLLMVTKFTDMGAYAIGSLLGRHKMVPAISPGKTWQGFAGSIAFAFLASYSAIGFFGDKIPLIGPGHAAVLAVILALAAVVGDLAESILKRSVATKDSGHFLPGIGGMLDLIDSVLFTAPIFYHYLLALGA